MDVYGLTGGIGSGKSTVASLLEEYGVPVVSADELSRVVVAPGSEGLRQVVAEFGEGVLDDRGELDRASMASVVFRDPEKRRRLEEILHPRIRERFEQVLDALEKAGHEVAIYEVPLLFEKNLQGEMKAVILVTAPEHVRMARVRARDDVTETEVRARMSAQMDEGQKRRRADYVIENDGNLDDLRREVEFLLARFLRVGGVVLRGPALDEPATPTEVSDQDRSYEPIATPAPSRRATEIPIGSPAASVAIRTGSTLPPGVVQAPMSAGTRDADPGALKVRPSFPPETPESTAATLPLGARPVPPPEHAPSPDEPPGEPGAAPPSSATIPPPQTSPLPAHVSVATPPSAPPLRRPDGASTGGGTRPATPRPASSRPGGGVRRATMPAPTLGAPTPPPPPSKPPSAVPAPSPASERSAAVVPPPPPRGHTERVPSVPADGGAQRTTPPPPDRDDGEA